MTLLKLNSLWREKHEDKRGEGSTLPRVNAFSMNFPRTKTSHNSHRNPNPKITMKHFVSQSWPLATISSGSTMPSVGSSISLGHMQRKELRGTCLSGKRLMHLRMCQGSLRGKGSWKGIGRWALSMHGIRTL